MEQIQYCTRTCHTSFWLRSVAVPTIRPLKLQHTSRENTHLTVMVKTFFPFSSPSPLPVLFCVVFFQACLRNRGWSLRWLEGGSSFTSFIHLVTNGEDEGSWSYCTSFEAAFVSSMHVITAGRNSGPTSWLTTTIPVLSFSSIHPTSWNFRNWLTLKATLFTS